MTQAPQRRPRGKKAWNARLDQLLQECPQPRILNGKPEDLSANRIVTPSRPWLGHVAPFLAPAAGVAAALTGLLLLSGARPAAKYAVLVLALLGVAVLGVLRNLARKESATFWERVVPVLARVHETTDGQSSNDWGTDFFHQDVSYLYRHGDALGWGYYKHERGNDVDGVRPRVATGDALWVLVDPDRPATHLVRWDQGPGSPADLSAGTQAQDGPAGHTTAANDVDPSSGEPHE